MPQVTKLFEITFDEPDMDWLNHGNLAMVLGAAFSDNEDELYKFNIRDLTNREQYEAKFAKTSNTFEEEGPDMLKEVNDSTVNTVDIDVPETVVTIDEEKSISNVQKRNDALRIKTAEKKVGPPHSAPGTGRACENPEISKEKLRSGGSITFCASCGHQYADTDLIKE